ncbi:MAG TPA: hypothetical protein DEG92_02635 [Rikenellaceae bacterium]|nr:hypothetical protein [Rikenellaceae bacterium]
MFSICPICQNGTLLPLKKQSRDYITNKSFPLVQCQSCECVITEVANCSTFNAHYGDIYYNSPKGKFSPILEKIFRWNHQRNAKKLYERWRPRNILEIGCGRAYLLRELKELGVDVFALESNAAAEWILTNDAVNVVSISDAHTDEWPFAPSFFKFVIYWHVLEHLADPGESLKQAKKVLEDEGILCVSIPNVSSYQARMGLTTWFHLDVPRHLFHFSRKGIVQLLEQSGFQVIDIRSGDFIQNLYGWFQSLANIVTPNNCNGLYRLMQGGQPLRTASKISVAVQLLTAVIWVPIGIIGCLVEAITKNYGNITVYARKSEKDK